MYFSFSVQLRPTSKSILSITSFMINLVHNKLIQITYRQANPSPKSNHNAAEVGPWGLKKTDNVVDTTVLDGRSRQMLGDRTANKHVWELPESIRTNSLCDWMEPSNWRVREPTEPEYQMQQQRTAQREPVLKGTVATQKKKNRPHNWKAQRPPS